MEVDSPKIIMVVQTTDHLHRLAENQLSLFSQKLHNSIENSLDKHNGKIMDRNDHQYIAHFKTATDAVLCALKIQHKFKFSKPKVNNEINELHLSLVEFQSDKQNAEVLGRFICNTISGNIIISTQIKNRYEMENKNIKIDNERIKVLDKSEFIFLKNLMEFLESNWRNPYLRISQLQKPLQYSSSQIYNKIKRLTLKSPSLFIRDYRLNKAMKSIHLKRGKIKDIARNSGFKSATYFSKCFKEHFNLLPSKYLQKYSMG